jgi:tetratricopeptide (TPR) repeat protein
MPIHSYSPSHTEIPDLDRLTTGAARHRLLGTLTEAVRAEVGRESHQHQLLIGPRGSGKTHTLTLVAHRLRTDPELQSQVLPIVLAEEEVASHPADLMKKVLEKLAANLDAGSGLVGREAACRECGHALAALRSEGDPERALEIAVGALEAASAALGRLLVAVIENLDTLFYAGPSLSRGTEIEGQWSLRRVLLESRGLLVLGAAPTLFGEVTDPEAPFYDFFRLHHLSELPPEEMLALIQSRLALELENETLDPARRTRLQVLADHYEDRIPKLRGLLVLTGGLPRFAHLIFDLLAETDLSSVAGTLSRFLDEQTPYFQSRLDPRLIPKAELEVLDAIASAEGPLTPKEVAARLRARSPNAVATCLKRLRERGLVKPTGPSRRDVRYDLTEPLFRVWRRFRRSRAERDQVVLLAEFVSAMFDRPELEADWQGLMKIEPAGLRRSVVEAALSLHGWRPPRPESSSMRERLPGHIKELVDRADQEYKTGSLPKMFELLSEALERMRREGPENALAWLLNRFALSAVFTRHLEAAQQAADEAEKLAFRQEDDLERANAILIRGVILIGAGNHSRAFEAVKAAEDLFQRVGADLGRGDCHYAYGCLAWAAENWEESLGHLLTAYRLYEKPGWHHNLEMVTSAVWSYLADAVSRVDADALRNLLSRTEPLLREIGTNEATRQGVIRFTRSLLTARGPEFLLDVLPVLESGLPGDRSTLLRPIRLAAEIQAGRRPGELPEEPEEMRRAVHEVLRLLPQGRET